MRKRQKLITIAEKSKDDWQDVAECESGELASGSEDQKRLKKAREASSRKRHQKYLLLWVLTISFSVIKISACILLCELTCMVLGSARTSYHIPCLAYLYNGNLRVK